MHNYLSSRDLPSNEVAPPQALAARRSRQNTELLPSDISPCVRKFDFPQKISWCVERALFHIGNFSPFLCREPLGTKLQAFTSRGRCVMKSISAHITSIPWRVPAAF